MFVPDSPATLAVYSSIDPPNDFPLGCPQAVTGIFAEGPYFCSTQDGGSN